MFRKLVFFSFILLITSFFTASKVFSQEPPQEVTKVTFNQAYDEYMGFFEEYNNAHAEYVLKRSQYLKFQTLKSSQDAYAATLTMLEKRDDVAVSYLKVLMARLEEGIGILESKKDNLFYRINEEIDWYTNHKNNLSTTGSLDDLVSDSNLAANRWLRVDPLAYEIMSVLAQGKITNYDKRMDEILIEMKDKIELIRADEREGYTFSSDKFQIIDRWIFEADGKITRSKEKQIEADNMIKTLFGSKKSSVITYNSIISKLTESQLFIKEANQFIKEIVKQVKIEE